MAIVWKNTINKKVYEVRSAGASRRLYTNGVFHSQWNPIRPITGSIWDLLALPVLFTDTRKIKRVLLLGVGGGAVAQVLEQFIQADEITGIELDAVHIMIAKKYFGLDSIHVTLINDDAISWLHSYNGEPFDLIVEDLFSEHLGEPTRIIELDRNWFTFLNKNLSGDGILVVNTIGPKQIRNSAFVEIAAVNKYFKTAFRLTLPTYENAVCAFFKSHVVKQAFYQNIGRLHDNKIKRMLISLPIRIYKLK